MDILSYILGKKAGGGGGEAVLINKNVDANGTYNAADDDADGYKSVTVDVSGSGTDYLAQAMNGTLTSYESNEVMQISSSLFRGYSYLTSIKIPNCTRMMGYALAQTQIENIVLPSIQRLGTWVQGIRAGEVFDSCAKLKVADLGASLEDLNNSVFNKCSLLTTVIMRSNSVVPLGGIGVFNSTPFASGGTGGTLYVPNDLISSYQGASNWSTILGYANNQIKSIESTHTDPNAPIDLTLYYADGTPIS